MIKTETVTRKLAWLFRVESAVVPISALTAWQGLFRKAKLERGQDVPPRPDERVEPEYLRTK